MIDLLDISLAARQPNLDSKWIEILIPVLIIIVYALSGILKMRSSLKEQQKSREETGPRYRPLDESGVESEPAGEEAQELDAARLEKLLEAKAMPRPQPVPRPPVSAERNERRTLDAFLATEAPKSLSERIVEARAKAEAAARAQEQARILALQAAQARMAERASKPQPLPPRGPEPPEAASPQRTAPAIADWTLWDDLREQGMLRKAIVYSEILGAPVALRDFDL